MRQVGEQARRIAHVVPPTDRDLLLAAAYLHDVGYAPELAETGLCAGKTKSDRSFLRAVNQLYALNPMTGNPASNDRVI